MKTVKQNAITMKTKPFNSKPPGIAISNMNISNMKTIPAVSQRVTNDAILQISYQHKFNCKRK